MNNFAVLTALGTDRVGIVDDLAKEISLANCNIEESKMSVLGGEFAVMLLVSGQNQSISELSGKLDEFREKSGISVIVKETGSYKRASDRVPYVIESVSLDHPGIVHSITSLLKDLGINIEDLETKTSPAPWTGAPLFTLKCIASLPQGTSISNFKDKVQEIAEKKDLDISLYPLSSGEGLL